jgi:cytoskeletal protein CcmA (bactofilin family)
MNLNNLTGAFMPDNVSSASKNFLTGDVDIKGTIKFETELNFDGKLQGEIISDGGILILGKNADVRGDVKIKSVVVYGTVTGNMDVAERCELKSTSQLNFRRKLGGYSKVQGRPCRNLSGPGPNS